METGLLIIFWYGLLHAFGPDHLSAIADFSIGKSRQKTFFITLAFAIGHGIMLFVFAQLLTLGPISPDLLAYADTIAAIVIVGMGIYLLSMVYFDRVHLKKHIHGNEEHIHIWFGKEHSHNEKSVFSAFSIGTLMGIGGVRGMLISLSMLNTHSIDFMMVIAFVLGAMVVFVSFGMLIALMNDKLLYNRQNVRRVVATAGGISLAVGLSMI